MCDFGSDEEAESRNVNEFSDPDRKRGDIIDWIRQTSPSTVNLRLNVSAHAMKIESSKFDIAEEEVARASLQITATSCTQSKTDSLS